LDRAPTWRERDLAFADALQRCFAASSACAAVWPARLRAGVTSVISLVTLSNTAMMVGRTSSAVGRADRVRRFVRQPLDI
jgi:hypothetical protein